VLCRNKVGEYIRGLTSQRDTLETVMKDIQCIQRESFVNFAIASAILKPLAAMARAFESAALNLSDAWYAFRWTEEAYAWMLGKHQVKASASGGPLRVFNEQHISIELKEIPGVAKKRPDVKEAIASLHENILVVRDKYLNMSTASLACLLDPRREFRNHAEYFQAGKEALDNRMAALGTEAEREAQSEWRLVMTGKAFRESQLVAANTVPPDEWWAVEAGHLPHLSGIAATVLGMTFTASPVERVNSMSGYVKDKKRNRLETERAAMLTRIYINARSLKSSKSHREDYGLASLFKTYDIEADFDDEEDDDEYVCSESVEVVGLQEADTDHGDSLEGEGANDADCLAPALQGGGTREKGTRKRKPTTKAMAAMKQRRRTEIPSNDKENAEFLCCGHYCEEALRKQQVISKFVLASFSRTVEIDGKRVQRWTAAHNCKFCKSPFHGFPCTQCEDDCCGSPECHRMHT